MKRIIGLGVLSLIMAGCASFPVTPENQSFEQAYGVQLLIVSRGLFSMERSLSSPGAKLMNEKLANGGLVLVLDPGQTKRAVIEKTGEVITVRINEWAKGFGNNSRIAILVAVLTALSETSTVMPELNKSPDEVKATFFKVLEAYDRARFGINDITQQSWYQNKELIITESAIQ